MLAEIWQQWESIDINVLNKNVKKYNALSAFLTSLILT